SHFRYPLSIHSTPTRALLIYPLSLHDALPIYITQSLLWQFTCVYDIVFIKKGANYMSSIKRLQKQLEETEKRIEEKKQEIHLSLGEEIVESLELDYDELNLVKDRRAMAERIKEHLNSSFFQENKEDLSEKNELPNETEHENQKGIQTEPQYNH